MTDIKKIVYVVHAVDAEGPLYESLDETFLRLKDLYEIKVDPTFSNLQKLRKKEIDLKGYEDVVAKTLSPSLLNYNDTWDKIDQMCSTILSKDFRMQLQDSFNNGWLYGWYCLDHVGYEINPRKRDMGYHNIHDKYLEFLDKYNSSFDDIQWHFHAMSTYREAHRCASSYENSPHLHQVLTRRIIDRNFFPSSFRAGFSTERPDSHWFLEQWIPFDCSNLAVEDMEEINKQKDCKNGKSADWRRAPNDWSVYHPDFYDYQKVGNCNRMIGRFLNISTRIASMSQYECDRAFKRANSEKPTLLGAVSHDFRDIGKEVKYLQSLIIESTKKYPDVKFKYSNARDAFNAICNNGKNEKLELKLDLYKEKDNYYLEVKTLKGEVFGPQPYLAIKTRSGRYIHDNFDFGLDGKSWHYSFDVDTVHSDDVIKIGVASNNKYGDTFIKVLDVNN